MPLVGKRPISHVDDHNEVEPLARVKTNPNTEQLWTIDDLIRSRAADDATKDTTLVYYPSSGTQYTGYTAAQLYELSNRAATLYCRTLDSRKSSDEPQQTVALLGPSNFDYLVTLLALSKCGHAVLLLSTRISKEAHVSLLKRCEAVCLFVDSRYMELGEKLRHQVPRLGKLRQIASQDEYIPCEEMSSKSASFDPVNETNKKALIIHSSGSTNLPKPVPQTHKAALGNFKSQFELVGFVTLPLYHVQGLGCIFRSIMNRKPVYMYNASLPLTTKHLITTLNEHSDIEILYGVPYVVKLLADSEEGIEVCKRLKVVFSGGAATPKPIGDKLTKMGVNLVCHLGSSETGQLMNSFRPKEDILEWDYLRPCPVVLPFLKWEPYDSDAGIYELIVLDGWPSKSTSNREDNSYATGDLYERHPTKNAWRYYARKDDTIVLVNGEKANPLLFEGLARESQLVKEAVVFGAQRPRLGMFIIPSDSATKKQYLLDEIWSAIEKGNQAMPAHAQLSKDMIRLFPLHLASKIGMTDKSTVIRSAFYKEFAGLIDEVYREAPSEGSLALNHEQLKNFLKQHIKEVLASPSEADFQDRMDLFTLGIDSLQAIQLRQIIISNIDIGGQTLDDNFIFNHPSIEAIAAELVRLRAGEPDRSAISNETRMETLIAKYGSRWQQLATDLPCVVVTGATGSLGAHLLAELAREQPDVKIICLVRASSNEVALARVKESFKSRSISVPLPQLEAYAADLSVPGLGLENNLYNRIASRLIKIIHCSWTVNFNLSLESFEDCIQGTRNLIDFALAAGNGSRPADLVFCSSISAASNNTTGGVVPEDFSLSLTTAQATGYGMSKLVAEQICLAATKANPINIKVLRIGQISADSRTGVWNATEAVPIMLRTAKKLGVLPRLDEQCSWLPVDTVARSIVQLSSTLGFRGEMFHVVNHKTFHWTETFLPMLRRAGLQFEDVDVEEWLRRIEADPDTEALSHRLLGFWKAKYLDNPRSQSLVFLSDKARAASSALNEAPAIEQEVVDKLVRYLSTL